MHNVITLHNVTKTYGSSRGVTNLNLEVPEGSVFGFLGPNGAGKTTTISMLINLTRPTSGHITIFGKDSLEHGLHNRRSIGFLAGDMALDLGLTGAQQLDYFAHLRSGASKHYIHELADRLHCDLHRKIKTLSRGNRQKIALIAALMHKPELLILDEPTSGLDPLIQAEFNKIILEHKAAGKTAFISSHVLSEVQELCDQIAIIREGAIVVNKPLADILAESQKHVTIRSTAKLGKVIAGLKGASNLTEQADMFSFTFAGAVSELLAKLAGKPISDITITNANLEDVFMRYYEGNHDV